MTHRHPVTATMDFLAPDILKARGRAVTALWGALHSTLASDAEVAVSPYSPPTLATVKFVLREGAEVPFQGRQDRC